MKRRWVALLVAASAALGATLNVMTRSDGLQSVPALPFTPALETQFTAHGLRVKLHAPAGKRFPAGLNATLTLETPAGPIRATGVTDASPQVSFELPYHRAGVTPVIVRIGTLTIRSTVRRGASRAISPLELNIGARAVRVGNGGAPAVVLHPVDANGNVSSEPLLIRAERPDGSSFEREIAAQHLVAWTFVPPGMTTGRLSIAALSLAANNTARGERGEVDVLPGPVASAQISSAPRALASGTRDPLELRFFDARDASGNPAVEGALVEFGSQTGPWFLFAARPLVRSAASLSLTPELPIGAYRLTARADRVTLQTDVRIRNADTTAWSVQLKGQVLHVVAPLDALGAWLDNGTPVTVRLETTLVSLERRLALEGGQLAFTLPPLSGALRSLEVSVAGQRRVLHFGRGTP